MHSILFPVSRAILGAITFALNSRLDLSHSINTALAVVIKCTCKYLLPPLSLQNWLSINGSVVIGIMLTSSGHFWAIARGIPPGFAIGASERLMVSSSARGFGQLCHGYISARAPCCACMDEWGMHLL